MRLDFFLTKMSRQNKTEVSALLEDIKFKRSVIKEFELKMRQADLAHDYNTAVYIKTSILPKFEQQLVEAKQKLFKLITLITFEIINQM